MTAFHWQCGVKNTKPPFPPMPARSSILYYCFVCFCEYNCCFLCVVYSSRKTRVIVGAELRNAAVLSSLPMVYSFTRALPSGHVD